MCCSCDILKFKIDGSYLQDEGITKCQFADPQIIETGTWSFSNNGTVLTVIPAGDTRETFTIALTATTLTVTSKNSSGGAPYTYQQIMTAQ